MRARRRCPRGCGASRPGGVPDLRFAEPAPDAIGGPGKHGWGCGFSFSERGRLARCSFAVAPKKKGGRDARAPEDPDFSRSNVPGPTPGSRSFALDRKSVVEGERVAVRLDYGGGRMI